MRDIAEGLFQLDPLRSYPARAASWVAKSVNATFFLVDFGEEKYLSYPPPPRGRRPNVVLPIKRGRKKIGEYRLYRRGKALSSEEERNLKWALRLYARGLSLVERLEVEVDSGDPEYIAMKVALTPRQKQVVQLLLERHSTHEIAETLGIKSSSVQSYVKEILKKHQVRSRAELVTLYR